MRGVLLQPSIAIQTVICSCPSSQSLTYDDAAMALSTLSIFDGLIFDAAKLMVAQLDVLVPRLLQLTRHQKMVVRKAALRALGVLTTLPTDAIYPYAQRVTRELVPALDDKKRLVRAEAVKSRNEW